MNLFHQPARPAPEGLPLLSTRADEGQSFGKLSLSGFSVDG
jgi:hypothetical protein